MLSLIFFMEVLFMQKLNTYFEREGELLRKW